MKVAAALLTTALAAISLLPHQVTHIRCAKLVAEDDYDRFEWVTRDGRQADVDASTCHPVRFWRAAMIEWLVDE